MKRFLRCWNLFDDRWRGSEEHQSQTSGCAGWTSKKLQTAINVIDNLLILNPKGNGYSKGVAILIQADPKKYNKDLMNRITTQLETWDAADRKSSLFHH